MFGFCQGSDDDVRMCFKKLCIFIIFYIKEYPVKYDVVTNDDLFEVHFNDLNLITLGPTPNSNFISNAML